MHLYLKVFIHASLFLHQKSFLIWVALNIPVYTRVPTMQIADVQISISPAAFCLW